MNGTENNKPTKALVDIDNSQADYSKNKDLLDRLDEIAEERDSVNKKG